MCNSCKEAHPSNGDSAVQDTSHTGSWRARVAVALAALALLSYIAAILVVIDYLCTIALGIGVLTALANFGI